MEIFISVDVETDGPIPGPNSMLSFGAAAINRDRKIISTYSANLDLLEGASPNSDTQKWWENQPEAWAACRKDPRDPAKVMPEFVAWVKSLQGTPVFVAYPAGFDFLFCYWYMIKFAGESPFSFSALDIKSYACAVLKSEFRKSTKRNFPKRWFNNLPPHTHIALDDAIEQGLMFMNILNENK
jgi:hypothetical protein